MRPNEIQTLFDYQYWAFERVWECIARLTDEQFVEQVDYSIGSIRNIVVHLMSATNRWLSRLQRTETPPHLAFEELNTLSAVKRKWDELRQVFLEAIQSLDQEQLDEVIHWEIPSRSLSLDTPRWEILLHVANHGTDHRAQILATLHQHFRVETVEQDMILFTAARDQA